MSYYDIVKLLKLRSRILKTLEKYTFLKEYNITYNSQKMNIYIYINTVRPNKVFLITLDYSIVIL